MTTDQPSFSSVMAARIADRERQDQRAKAKGRRLLECVLRADLESLPAEVRAARVELEREYQAGGQCQ